MDALPLQRETEYLHAFRAFSRLTGVLLVAVALLVLAGWQLDWPVLTSLVPGQQSMKASTALGFILAGVALRASLSSRRRDVVASLALSLALSALGLVNLAAYAGWLSLPSDRWYPDPYALAHGMPPGRMSNATALAFVLLGGMGVLGRLRRWLWLREAIAVVLLAIAVLALARYGSRLGGGQNGLFLPLALHTAILLLVATLGWMASTPDRGLTRVATADSIGGAVARSLLLPALLLPVAITFALEGLKRNIGVGDDMLLSLAALLSGGTMCGMIWWVAQLLDRVERQRREAEQLRDSANLDALTGLINRRGFDSAIDQLLRGRRERDAAFSMLMLDLDHFKDYNDDFGHQAGDDVLRQVGRLLRAALRPADLPARYGGEEFALLLPETDLEHAHGVAERVLADFRAATWPLRPVTVSIGVAEAHRSDDARELIRRADQALYAAKHEGRDRAVVAVTPEAVVASGRRA